MANKDVSEMALYDVVEPSGMTVGEIITSFRQAKDRKQQLQKLADLTCTNVDFVKELLLTHGVKPVEMPRTRRKKEPPENFRGGGGDTSTRPGTEDRAGSARRCAGGSPGGSRAGRHPGAGAQARRSGLGAGPARRASADAASGPRRERRAA